MTQFLHPISTRLPSQGAYEFIPEFYVFDEPSPALLQAAMNANAGVQGVDPDNFYVVEEIEYKVYVTPPPMNDVRYTAMVWVTKVIIV